MQIESFFKSRIKTFYTLLVSLLALGVGTAFFYGPDLGACFKIGESSCNHFMIEVVGQPLSQGAFFGLIPVAVLLFIFPTAFNAWKRFAIWFIPLAILLIVLSPTHGGFMTHDSELTTWFMSGIYVLVSSIVIVRARKKK